MLYLKHILLINLLTITILAYHEAAADDAQASAALSQCDALASHPNDPGRFSAGVPDDQLAPGRDIPICEAAAKLNPDQARAWFELGRVYWSAHRDTEALSAFVEAAKRDYAPAMKYIGDAFLHGRGLPTDFQQDAYTAKAWYEKSSAGFPDGMNALHDLEDYLAKNQFDKSIFQNQEFMTKLYSNQFDPESEDMFFNSYLTAFMEKLRSQEMFFMDQLCAPQITEFTLIKIRLHKDKSLGKPAIDNTNYTPSLAGYMNNPGAYLLSGLTGGITESMNSTPLQMTTDQGTNDAIALERHYGCNSNIVKTITCNIAAKYGTSATNVTCPNGTQVAAQSAHPFDAIGALLAYYKGYTKINEALQGTTANDRQQTQPAATSTSDTSNTSPTDSEQPASASPAADNEQTTQPTNDSSDSHSESSTESASFQAGAQARNTWETWFKSLNSDAQRGAEYWASVRNTKPRPHCSDGNAQDSADFMDACIKAKRLLAPVDKRRNTEPDYWRGWNSYSTSQ